MGDSVMAILRLALAGLLVATCLASEVTLLESQLNDPPAPPPAAGSTQVTLPALDAEVARAKQAEAKLKADLEAEVTARTTEDQALLKKTEDNKALVDAEVSARDKLASDTTASVDAVSTAVKKNTDDRA